MDEALEPAHQEATTSQKLLGSTTADADPTLESAGQKSAPIEATAQKIGSQVLTPSPNHIEKVLQEFDATASWYVRPPGGGQYGPANTETFGQWIQEGRVAASSLVWRDGWSQWRTATEAFPDISAQLPGAAEDLSLGDFDTQAASSAKALREKSTGDSAIANRKLPGRMILESKPEDVRSDARFDCDPPYCCGLLAERSILLPIADCHHSIAISPTIAHT